jgi:hypothetical protein
MVRTDNIKISQRWHFWLKIAARAPIRSCTAPQARAIHDNHFQLVISVKSATEATFRQIMQANRCHHKWCQRFFEKYSAKDKRRISATTYC